MKKKLADKDIFINSNFNKIVEFPIYTIGDILPFWTLYIGVSSDFLDMFVNHVDIIKSFIISRYQDRTETEEKVYSFNKYKDNYSYFGDDLILLGKPIKTFIDGKWVESLNDYWYFWYDSNMCDCVIGRFKANKNVINEFIIHCNAVSIETSKLYSMRKTRCDDNIGYPAIEVDLQNTKKWRKFNGEERPAE